MSRIVRSPVDAGQVVDATTLNNTYNDYDQPTALDANNTRDQAFDVPHFNNVPLIKNKATAGLGDGTMLHTGPFRHYVSNAAGIAVFPVTDVALTPTFMNLSATPWVAAAGDVVRIWWNYSVNSVFPPTHSDTAGTLGRYAVEELGSSPPVSITITDGLHCWLAYLEWDITSAALVNWVPLPGQMSPTLAVKGTAYNGFEVSKLNAATVISPWQISSIGLARDGAVPAVGLGVSYEHGWFAPYGMYCQELPQAVTIYGIRLVITGVLHPAHNPAGSQSNLLVYDYAMADAGFYLQGRSGRISAVHMRGS